MKDKILKLREEGLTYNQIVERLGCSKATVSYHCGAGQKTKNNNRQKNRRSKNPLIQKIETFSSTVSYDNINLPLKITSEKAFYARVYSFMKKNYQQPSFNVEEVKNKIGDNPVCYLTGASIDLNKTKTYELDHIIPRSKGGSNSIDNLGICTKAVNRSKNDMTLEEYIDLCKQVLENNGYIVVKNENDH